ncbi:MAG: hypothetical protein WAU03_01620 [Candidatus Saccharimonas aalborgensis]
MDDSAAKSPRSTAKKKQVTRERPLYQVNALKQTQPEARRSRKKLIISIVAGSLVLLLAIGGAVAYILLSGRPPKAEYQKALDVAKEINAIATNELVYSDDQSKADKAIQKLEDKTTELERLNVWKDRDVKLAFDFYKNKERHFVPALKEYNKRLKEAGSDNSYTVDSKDVARYFYATRLTDLIDILELRVDMY